MPLHSEQSDREKQDYLARQLREYSVGQRASVLCPWCGGMNGVDIPLCCQAFAHGKERVGYDQMENVERQYRTLMVGARSTIDCPYCGFKNKRPETGHQSEWSRPNVNQFCCDQLCDALTAVVERVKVQHLAETKKRIEDALSDGFNGVRDERVAKALRAEFVEKPITEMVQ